MSDYTINIFLDDDRMAKLAEVELAGNVVTIEGKQAIQISLNAKEQKKLVKGFNDLVFDDANACVLPQEADEKLFGIVLDMKTLDVMKFAIMKLYNPLAGKAPRSAQR